MIAVTPVKLGANLIVSAPRRRAWFAVVGLVIAALAPAQAAAPTPEVARLERQLATASPEAQSRLLTALAHALDPIDAQQARTLAQKALAAARTERDALGALIELASLERRIGDYAKAMATARDGLARATALDDGRLRAEFLYLVGRIHWNLTDYPASIEAHLQELRIATTLADAAALAKAHTGLGLTYESFGQPENALEQLRAALGFATQTGDKEQLALVLNSLGNHFLDRKDYAQAGDYHRRALQLRETLGSTRGVADSLVNLGLVAEATGDPATALDDYQRACAIYEQFGLKRYLANIHRRIGATLGRAGRTDEALAHLRAALDIAEPLGSQEVLANIYAELARVHEGRGEWATALGFERRRAAAMEAVRRESDRQQVAEFNARYALERREREIERLRGDQAVHEAEIRRQRFQSVALGALLGLGVVVFAAVFWVQRTRLRAERRLRAATEEARRHAEAAERLKSRLLQIASHDLKAPLAALNASANRLERAPSDAETVARLAAGMRADTARMGALVRDFLDAAAVEAGRLHLHPASLDLATVARSAVEGLRGVADAKQQRLTLTTPPTPLNGVAAEEDRLRQVFDNLLSNALKFTPVGGAIEVVLGESANWVFAEVRDNGPGLRPQDFARIFAPQSDHSAVPTSERNSTGLGLLITRELLALHGGRLEVESQPGCGAVFRVLLPTAGRGASPEAVAQTPAHERGHVV